MRGMGGCGGVCMRVTGAGGHVKERLSDSIDLVSFPDLHIQCMEIGNVPRPDLYSFVFWKPV